MYFVVSMLNPTERGHLHCMESSVGQAWLIRNMFEGASLVARGKEYASQCRRHRFEPWVWKIPHAVEQLSPCATTIEPVLWSLGAAPIEVCMPKSLSFAAREATTM